MAFSFGSISKLFGSKKAAPPSRVVGIDIGSSSVKVVELEKTDRALMLRTYGELQLGPYANESLGQVVKLDLKSQTEAVVDVLREAQVESKRGVLAMPLSSSFVTVIPVNVTNGDDIEAKINVEARKFIPLPLSEVTLNWTVLEPVEDPKATTKEVLLAAIENKALGDYRLLLNSIDMSSEPSEIEVFSVIRALAAADNKLNAIIDIGAKTTKLYLTRNGMLERVHRSTSGGVQINQGLMQQLSVSFDEAESIKRMTDPNDPHSRDLQNILIAVLEGPLREFGRLISSYEARTGTQIESIICCGGVSNIIGVTKVIEDVLSKPVTRANPFARVAYPAFMEDEISELAPSFCTALGAALRLYEQ